MSDPEDSYSDEDVAAAAAAEQLDIDVEDVAEATLVVSFKTEGKKMQQYSVQLGKQTQAAAGEKTIPLVASPLRSSTEWTVYTCAVVFTVILALFTGAYGVPMMCRAARFRFYQVALEDQMDRFHADLNRLEAIAHHHPDAKYLYQLARYIEDGIRVSLNNRERAAYRHHSDVKMPTPPSPHSGMNETRVRQIIRNETALVMPEAIHQALTRKGPASRHLIARIEQEVRIHQSATLNAHVTRLVNKGIRAELESPGFEMTVRRMVEQYPPAPLDHDFIAKTIRKEMVYVRSDLHDQVYTKEEADARFAKPKVDEVDCSDPHVNCVNRIIKFNGLGGGIKMG